MLYKWEVVQSEGARSFNTELSPIIERILASRGINTYEELRAFIDPDFSQEHDPFLLAGMNEAVIRLNQALEQGERVLIHGDYDADGITASVLLSEAFAAYGIDSEIFVPTREDGYGLQREAILMAQAQGFRLIVTVDCGITACDEADFARELGIDLIITDHHTPPEVIPTAVAVINPKLKHCPYPFKDLAGVGVAYKLAAALLDDAAHELLDLVAIGTVADLVPLKGENRLYVKQGLLEISTPRVGLGALMQAAGVDPDHVTAGNIGYTIAPRLNAAGRLQDASLPIELLLTSDFDRANEIAGELDALNRERQKIESSILEEAMGMVDPSARALVLYAPHWSHGVVGIVASRLVERFYRPTILLCRDEDGKLRGSGRSISGFDLVGALRRCDSHLERCGGHTMAAGLSLLEEALPAFIAAFAEVAAEIEDLLLVPKLRIDAEVGLAEITEPLLEDLELLAPFGMGNPQPNFSAKGVKVIEKRLVGKQNEHLRLGLVGEGGQVASAIMFGQANRLGDLEAGQKLNIAFRPTLDEYRGRRSISLRLQDFTHVNEQWLVTNPCILDKVFSGLPQEARDRFFAPAHNFSPFLISAHDKVCKNLTEQASGANLILLTPALDQAESSIHATLNYSVDTVLVYNGKGQKSLLAPDRGALATYYKYFTSKGTMDLVQFAKDFGLYFSVAYSVAASSTHIFQELGLMSFRYQAGVLIANPLPTAQKQELSRSQAFMALQTWNKEDVT